MKYHTTEVMSPPSQEIQCCLRNFVFGGLQKKKPFLLMMLGTSDHNIEVGGCGGKARYLCGFLWMAVFFEGPGMLDIMGM